jgi:hypothetical protein
VPYFGCDQNSHFDHDNTVELIRRLKTPPNHTVVYGYVTIGGENTARVCWPNLQPVPLAPAEIEERIDAWTAMGVGGIFLDEAEYGFGSSRALQNAAIDYVHSKGLSVFINGFNPADVFDTAVTNAVFYTTGYYAGTDSSVAMNPQGESTPLGPGDIFLLEHFQVINGTYQDPAFWASRADSMAAYKDQYGVQVATVTTQGADPTDADCNGLFDQQKFDYAWWSTLLYGFDFMSWGEPLGFSSWGPCSSQLPFHVRPDVGDIGSAFVGLVRHPLPGDTPVHTRATTAGVIGLDVAAHTGSFTPPSTYAPESVTILTGQYVWGTLSSFNQPQPDWDTYDIRSSRAASSRVADWSATARLVGSTAVVSSLTVHYEGQYSKANVTQEFYLYNYETASWELFDTRLVGNRNDVAIRVEITDNPQHYIAPSGDMQVRVRGVKNLNFYCWANFLTWEIN